MYCRKTKPSPVWLTLEQLESVANISGCKVSLKDGGVLFNEPGYRCLQFTEKSSRPMINSDDSTFIINEGKDVVLKIKCEGRRLAKIEIAKFIATLLHHIHVPENWFIYTGYIEDLRKYYK